VLFEHDRRPLMRLRPLLVMVLLHLPASAADDRLPEIIRHRYNPAVLAWVSESAAFDANGRLRKELAAASPMLESNMRRNTNGRCEAFMLEAEMEHFLPDETVEDVATSSLIALSGDVVHVSRGFFHDFPGTVVGFRVTGRLGLRAGGGMVRVEVGDIRYTFIAAAQLLRPDGAICSSPPRPVTIPDPGDSILMFAYALPIDAEELIIPVDSDRHLVIERGGNRIFTPVNLESGLRDLTIPDVMRRVADIADEARSEP
jgi:hypothetical protein